MEPPCRKEREASMELRILALGDVCGASGLTFLQKKLWQMRKYYSADFVVINGENAAVRGITPAQARTLRDAGADVITLGNHAFSRREIASCLDDEPYIVRPANWASSLPGTGMCFYPADKAEFCVINLIGRVGMNAGPESPFDTADALLAKARARTKFIIVDFHAEATSEKIALAYHIDGRASILFGTHTHVQTADERVFPRGLGYLTDLGMTGAVDSVIGVRAEQSVAFFRGNFLSRFEDAGGAAAACGALFKLDESGRCTGVERIRMESGASF